MNSAELAVPRQLRLEGELTIYRAAELHAMLKDTLSGAARCTLELDAVTEVDSTGVQLLLAARRTARENACELAFVGLPEALADALNVFGLTGEFGAASRADAITPDVEHAYGA